MIKSQEFSKFIFSFLTVIKDWFVFSYRPLWFGLKKIIINEYPAIFRALAPFFNFYSAIGLFFFILISYRFDFIIEAYRALFIISLMILVIPVIPTILIPVGLAAINTLLAFRVIDAFRNFLKPTHTWKISNILNSILSDESVLFSSFIIAFSLAAGSFTPPLILGSIQSINFFFKTAKKIYKHFMTARNIESRADAVSVNMEEKNTFENVLIPVNTTEHVERVLELLKDSENDYILSENNNFYLRHATEIGRWDVVLRLLKKPNVASNVTCNDCAVIALAIQQDQWEVIKKIIKNPFYACYPLTEGKVETLTIMFSKMIIQDKNEVINLIVSSGFYKHYAVSSRIAMLFFSAANHDLTVINILLKSKKLLSALDFQGFSLLFGVIKDDEIKKLSNSTQNLIEHVKNTDWQDVTLFDLPVKHLIDKKDLNSLPDCKIFFTDLYGFLNQKLKGPKLVNLFSARFMLAKKRYTESKGALSGITVELDYLDEFHDIRLLKFDLHHQHFFIPTMGKQNVYLENLIEKICVVYLSKAFELEMKKNPKWTLVQKNHALNCLTHINSTNVKKIFLATEHLLADMSFAETLLKHFIEKELPKVIDNIIHRLPDYCSYFSEEVIKEKIKAMTYQITYHFLCMGDNPVFFRVLNNCILNSDCVAEDIHFEQNCPFPERTIEQKLYTILAKKLNEEAKKLQLHRGIKIIHLKEIASICHKLVVFQLEKKEMTASLQDLKKLMIDININELETFLIAAAIKVEEKEVVEVIPITPQFDTLRNPINETITTQPIITNEDKAGKPRVL